MLKKINKKFICAGQVYWSTYHQAYCLYANRHGQFLGEQKLSHLKGYQ